MRGKASRIHSDELCFLLYLKGMKNITFAVDFIFSIANDQAHPIGRC
jgi:hypothetical protein